MTTSGGAFTVFDVQTGVIRMLGKDIFLEMDFVNGTKRKLDLRWAVEDDEAEADTETPSVGR